MLEACADQQEALAAAKQAYSDNPTQETLTARREAMANMHAFRSFVRSVARVRRLRYDLAYSSALKAAPDLRAAAEAELRALEADYGAFADAPQPVPQPSPGDAAAEPKTIRAKGRTNPVGGA